MQMLPASSLPDFQVLWPLEPRALAGNYVVTWRIIYSVYVIYIIL